jgi:hypothetical protein
MILLHELAHVRRHDNLINLLQRLVEALLFFHPGVWKLSAWVRLERELCCDRLVIRHTREPLAYAETLALLAVPQMSPRHALAAMASHQLVTRIRHMLNLEGHPMKVSRKVLVAALAVVVTLGLWIGAQAQTTKEEPTDTDAEKIADEKPAKKEEFVVKVYSIEQGTASEAAELVNSLAKQRDIDRLQVEVDARTSSLVVRYPRRLENEVDDLVQEARRKAEVSIFRVFRLKSTDLGEAVRRLKAELADERGVRIEPDHETHSLLIQHPERLEERIDEAVRQIEPQSQSLKADAATDSSSSSEPYNRLPSWFESGGLPESEDDKLSFIRRLTADLQRTPTYEEVEEFLKDDSPQAEANLLRRMLKETLKREPSSDDVRQLLSRSRISDEVTKNLFEAELHLQELSQSYGGSHPKMVAARQKIDALKQQMRAQEAHKRRHSSFSDEDAALWAEYHRFKDHRLLDKATCSKCHDQSAADALKGWRQAMGSDAGQARTHAEQYFDLLKIETKRPYSPEQATGAPDTPHVGDHPTAWAPLEHSSGEEWLKLTYEQPIEAVAVVVYETWNPGAVVRLEVLDAAGKLLHELKVEDRATQSKRPHVAVFPLPGGASAPVSRLKMIIDSRRVQSFNEIDAVGLLDAAGQVHWATSATASSTYADAQPQEAIGAANQFLIGTALNSIDSQIGRPSEDQADDPEPRVKRLEDEVQQLRKSIDDLKELLKKQPDATSNQSGELRWRGEGQELGVEAGPNSSLEPGISAESEKDSPADIIAQLLEAVAADKTDEAAQLLHPVLRDQSGNLLRDIGALMKEARHFRGLSIENPTDDTARITTRSWRAEPHGKQPSANLIWELRKMPEGWRVTAVREANGAPTGDTKVESIEGVRISIPALGPNPTAIDFGFPLSSTHSQDLSAVLREFIDAVQNKRDDVAQSLLSKTGHRSIARAPSKAS